MTQKLLFTVTNVLFHFLQAILCPEHKILLKTILSADFAIVASDGIFWLSIVKPQHSDFMWMRGTVIVTSYLLIVLAYTNWLKGNLH